MKPPFFVCSRPLRAHSFAGGNGPQRASLFPPPQESQKGSSQTIPHPSLFPQCRDVPLLIVPLFHSGKPVLLTRAPTVPTITATCFIEVPTCSRSLPRIAEKSETFCANKGTFIRKRPTFSPNRATSSWNVPRFPTLLDFSCGMARLLCSIARFLLQHRSISFAFPRLTLRSPSNTQVPPSHRSPTTSSSLCSPSVNSLSTTTAAP